MNTEPIVIPIQGDPSDFVADANKVNSSLSGVQNSTKKTSMSITDMRSAFQLAGDAARVVGEVWKNTAGEAVEYDEKVKNLSRSLGISAEETSKIIQVADDVRVSYDTLKIAMKEAQKDGITPNTEGLAKLSDQYLALQPGVERTKFLLDTFGKSGLEMGKLMEKGSDGIREMSDAIDDNLIVTEDAIKASDEYQKNLDDLTDAIQGQKIAIGNELIPVANTLLELYKKTNETIASGEQTYSRAALYTSALAIQQENLTERINDASAARWNGLASLYETETITEDVTVSVEDLTKANQDYLNTIGDVTSELDDYNDKQADLKDTQADLLAEKQKLIDEGWWAESDAIREINDKLAENEQAQAQNAEAFDLATKSRMLSMLEEQLAVDGLDKKETDFLLQQGLKWGIYSQEAIDAMAAVQRQVDAMERNIDININVRTNYSQAGQAALEQQYQYGSGRASGGSVEPGKMYPVNERGVPELLSYNGSQMLMMPNGGGSGFVTPLDSAGSNNKAGGGSPLVIQFLLDSATPDPERTAYSLKPAIERVIRDMQRAGTV